MTRELWLAMLAAAAALLPACNFKHEHGNPEQFIRSFVQVLRAGDEDHYDDFYLRPDEYDTEPPGAEGFIERMTGAVRARFWDSCRKAHEMLAGKEVVVEEIVFREGKERAPLFLQNVEDHQADVTVQLRADEEIVNLRISEMVKVGKNWRMTTFTVYKVVVEETKKLPDKEITINDGEEQEQQ